MARYRGTIQGHRGEASRLGTPISGLIAHADGWDIGARVKVRPCGYDPDKDEVEIYLTAGSNAMGRGVIVGTFVRDGERIVAKDTEEIFRLLVTTKKE